MGIDLEKARAAKEELKLFLHTNNILYHFVGLDKGIADWHIIVGLDESVDLISFPDTVNTVKIIKQHTPPVSKIRKNSH